jgi:hypothetical protein
VADYLEWCNQIRNLSLDLPGVRLESANDIRSVISQSGEWLALKRIRPDTEYIPRLKILGEVAYSLFDWHLNPAERVSPNVCPISPNTLWRQFLPGQPGENWRGELYRKKNSLEAADLSIVDKILASRFAQRIALLDFIFLCQDRSARNWIEKKGRFWAVDNGMFWPYKGRYIDKEALKTSKVNHLRPPMEALVSRDYKFAFKIGVFSSLHAGSLINDGLLMWLSQIEWGPYFGDLSMIACTPLDYPPRLVEDWRFDNIKRRADWLLDKRRFPTVSETDSEDWQQLIKMPPRGRMIWRRGWEKVD